MRYSREHFTHGAPPRIMGSESEINVNGITNRGGSMVFSEALENIDYISHGRSPENSIVLPNGGEIYLDGAVVEIATPECLTAQEVLLHELVGERVVGQMANNIAGGNGTAYKRSGYAKITKESGELLHDHQSTGHHENYFYIRPTDSSEHTLAQAQMKSFLYTRQSWAGTGLVTPLGYAISQKIGAIDFTDGTSFNTHGQKNPLRVHNTPRMEVRTGEGNLSEWTIIQKFALTSLVLRLIEHKKFPDHLIVKKYEEGNSQTALYTPFSEVNTRGGWVKSTSHQREIARRALDYFCDVPNTPKEELEAAAAIIRTCNDIDKIGSMRKDVSSIHDRVEWASKLSFLRREHSDESLTTDNFTAVAKDLRWDNINNGIGKRWYRRYGQTTESIDIDAAAKTPPRSRAAVRVQDLKRLRDEGVYIHSVDWDTVTYDQGEQYYGDPYEEKAT